MSDYLTKGITIGTKIMLTWPLGHMTDDKIHNKYLLISTGSWVSPMVWLHCELAKNSDNKVVNIFGERHHRHMLPSVEKQFTSNSDNVKNILFLSQDDHARYRRWHVQEALDEGLQFLGSKDITIFICGSPMMVDDVRQMLTERWFSKEQIKYEKY